MGVPFNAWQRVAQVVALHLEEAPSDLKVSDGETMLGSL